MLQFFFEGFYVFYFEMWREYFKIKYSQRKL